MVEPNNEENYKSPFVEERFYQKPQSKHIIGEILRIDHVLKNCEEYFETIGVVAGWSRTVRQTYKFHYKISNIGKKWKPSCFYRTKRRFNK